MKGKTKEFSPEQEQFVRDNYRTMLNKDLGEKLGVSSQYMKKLFVRLGIKRTKEEIQSVINLKSKPVIDMSSKLTIEGGGRGNSKARYHRTCWVKLNGPIRNNHILMYETKDYDNWKDLRQVHKDTLESFKIKREAAIGVAERKEKRVIQLEIKAIRKSRKSESIKAEQESQKRFALIKANPRTLDHEMEMGKVPVRLDSRTLMYVKREKCIQMEDGSFQLKSGVTTLYKPIGEENGIIE